MAFLKSRDEKIAESIATYLKAKLPKDRGIEVERDGDMLHIHGNNGWIVTQTGAEVSEGMYIAGYPPLTINENDPDFYAKLKYAAINAPAFSLSKSDSGEFKFMTEMIVSRRLFEQDYKNLIDVILPFYDNLGNFQDIQDCFDNGVPEDSDSDKDSGSFQWIPAIEPVMKDLAKAMEAEYSIEDSTVLHLTKDCMAGHLDCQVSALDGLTLMVFMRYVVTERPKLSDEDVKEVLSGCNIMPMSSLDYNGDQAFLIQYYYPGLTLKYDPEAFIDVFSEYYGTFMDEIVGLEERIDKLSESE